MGGKIDAVDSAVNYQLPDTLTAGFFMWVKNTGAGNITISLPAAAPSGTHFLGGADTFTLPTGKYGCFTNIGGKVIQARIF